MRTIALLLTLACPALSADYSNLAGAKGGGRYGQLSEVLPQVGEPTAPVAVDSVLESPAPVSELWFYTQAGCPPCRTMDPIVDRIEASGVKVHRIDCTGKNYSNVQATPLFRFSVNGRRVGEDIVGATTEERLLASLRADDPEQQTVALAVDDAAPTPYAEVIRGLSLLPAPAVAFVDYGCGADARWCVAAVEKWDCKCYGIEMDPERAAAARRHVAELGFDDRIEIIEGDATEIDVDADVGAVYLYPETLEALRPKLESLTAFISYMHRVPGLSMTQNGDSFLWRKTAPVQYAQTQQPQPQQVTSRPYAVYGNQIFYGPCCNNMNCQMRAAIMSQLGGAMTVLGVAFVVGTAIGCLVGWIVGNECGTANGAREERARMAQAKQPARQDDMIRTAIRQ